MLYCASGFSKVQALRIVMMSFPLTTRAAMFLSEEEVVVRERSLPELEESEIVVEVEACGICGTDIAALREGRVDYESFGHEVAGRIAGVGQVVLESSSACGRCSNCRNMKQELCEKICSFWPRGYFGFAERMVSPVISAVPYEGLAPDVACLSEPLGVALDMLRLVEICPGSVVLVSGLGPIGLMALRLAKLAGASRIYAVSYSHLKARNELARAFGADEVLLEDKSPVTEYIFPQKPDRFLVTAPPKVLPAMFQVAAKGSILTYIGIAHGEGARVEFDANDFHFKKLQLRASFASPALLTPLALRLLREGAVDGRAMITHRFGLEDMAEAVRVACREKARCIKVVMLRN
ncbi:L-galactonate oxidoreductase [soil metagenome]